MKTFTFEEWYENKYGRLPYFDIEFSDLIDDINEYGDYREKLVYDKKPSITDNWQRNIFIQIDNQHVRCEVCGSNMFSKNLDDDSKYKCQGCGTLYDSK